MVFKAEAQAEKKKLQAQGLKAGEDFMDCKTANLLGVLATKIALQGSLGTASLTRTGA
jgi:hypothetical protein